MGSSWALRPAPTLAYYLRKSLHQAGRLLAFPRSCRLQENLGALGAAAGRHASVHGLLELGEQEPLACVVTNGTDENCNSITSLINGDAHSVAASSVWGASRGNDGALNRSNPWPAQQAQQRLGGLTAACREGAPGCAESTPSRKKAKASSNSARALSAPWAGSQE